MSTTRNTPILERILKALSISDPKALATLEEEFKDSLLVVVSDITTIASQAEELRLAISTDECAQVLDYLAPFIELSIEETEEAINTLFPDRFIEP